MSFVPGVPGHPPWSGVPKDMVMPPSPRVRVDGVYDTPSRAQGGRTEHLADTD